MIPHRFLLRLVVAFWLGAIGGLLVAPLVDANAGIDGGTNEIRAEAGLAPLETSALLTDLAAQRAAELYPPESGFHHAYWWVDKVGCWAGAGENIAYRIPTPDSDAHWVQKWYDSAPHRANMLGDYTLTGSAVFIGPDGGGYAVQLFLKPCAPEPQAPAPTQAPKAPPPPPAPPSAPPAVAVLPDTALDEPFFPGFFPLSVFIGASGLLLAYEFWTLATGRPPITRLTRDFQRNHPHIAGLMLLAIGILFGHLFWP